MRSGLLFIYNGKAYRLEYFKSEWGYSLPALVMGRGKRQKHKLPVGPAILENVSRHQVIKHIVVVANIPVWGISENIGKILEGAQAVFLGGFDQAEKPSVCRYPLQPTRKSADRWWHRSGWYS